jgi:Terminase RNaseH-like domain
VIGVDYGHSPDPCAWVVLAADPHSNFVAVVHAEKAHRLTSDEICAKTNDLRVTYRAERIVGDSASGGKTFIQDFNERHARAAGFYMQAADKADKRDSIDLVNTELRHQRLVMLTEGAGMLIDEMEELVWDEDYKEFLPGNDHLYDGLRYGFRALRAFVTKPAANEPTEEERELQRVIARNERAKSAAGGGFFG